MTVAVLLAMLALLGGLTAWSWRLGREVRALRADVATLSKAVEELAAPLPPVAADREPAAPVLLQPSVLVPPLVTDDVAAEPRLSLELVTAATAARPVWVPAAPVREAMIRGVAWGHGLRMALRADARDRIAEAARTEVRRSRRQRRHELRLAKRLVRQGVAAQLLESARRG